MLSSLNTQVREKWKSFLAGFEPSQAKQTGFEINTGLLPFIQQLRLEQQKFDFLTPLKKIATQKNHPFKNDANLIAQLLESSKSIPEFLKKKFQEIPEGGVFMTIEPNPDNRTFNSLMPYTALESTKYQSPGRTLIYESARVSFGFSSSHPASKNLRNAVLVFPKTAPEGKAWDLGCFDDLMNDPLDNKGVYLG